MIIVLRNIDNKMYRREMRRYRERRPGSSTHTEPKATAADTAYAAGSAGSAGSRDHQQRSTGEAGDANSSGRAQSAPQPCGDLDTKIDMEVVRITPIDELGINIKNKVTHTVVTKNDRITFDTMYSMVRASFRNNVLRPDASAPVPLTTDIPCFWCHRAFETSPIGVPIKYENQEFTVYGNFCSFNCAVAYIDHNARANARFGESLVLLYKMYETLTSSHLKAKILPAPHFEVLSRYGGTLSDEEFGKALQQVTITDSKQFKVINNCVKLFNIDYMSY